MENNLNEIKKEYNENQISQHNQNQKFLMNEEIKELRAENEYLKSKLDQIDNQNSIQNNISSKKNELEEKNFSNEFKIKEICYELDDKTAKLNLALNEIERLKKENNDRKVHRIEIPKKTEIIYEKVIF